MIEAFLSRLSSRLPWRDIPLPDGSPYLRRFLIGRINQDDYYLHQYLGDDAERWLHNHPWRTAVGIPLVGGYTEERLRGLDPYEGIITRIKHVRRFIPNIITDFDFHRILSVKPGTWTLFIGLDRYKEWGFLEDFHDATTPLGHKDVLFRQPKALDADRIWKRNSHSTTFGRALLSTLQSYVTDAYTTLTSLTN